MPSSRPLYSSAASDVYKSQGAFHRSQRVRYECSTGVPQSQSQPAGHSLAPVSYTHLRAHETRHDLVCRLLDLSIRRQRQMCIRVRGRSTGANESGTNARQEYRNPKVSQQDIPLLLSLIHISEPTRLGMISYAVF